MKLEFLGIKLEIGKADSDQRTDGQKLAELGSEARKDQAREKIKEGYKKLLESGKKYSEYQLQKYSGVSINTIKKHRDFIDTLKSTETGLFAQNDD
jgi:hypothetical protein